MAAVKGVKTRTEKDSLGELEVPASAYYGVQTARAVFNFPISGIYPSDQAYGSGALIEAYVHMKRAAAVVNHNLGMLDKPRCDAIVSACDHVLSGNLREQWVVDAYQAGAGTSFNMNTNEVLANYANEQFAPTPADKKRGAYTFVNPNDHVNMAQSTNDTMPTAIRLSNIMLLPETLSALDLLMAELRAKGKAFKDVITTGRTHLQDATPITLGQVFTAFADCLVKARARIVDAEQAAARHRPGRHRRRYGHEHRPALSPGMSPGSSGTQLGVGITSAANIIEMHNSMADPLAFSAALRSLAADLTRICNDLRLLSSGPTSGIGEINLPPVQPGSSIMPGKVNPVMLEMFNMVCYQVIGLDAAVLGCAQAGQFQLNVMMPMIAFDLLHMQTILANSMRVVAEFCIRGITANTAAVPGVLRGQHGPGHCAQPDHRLQRGGGDRQARGEAGHADHGRAAQCEKAGRQAGAQRSRDERGIQTRAPDQAGEFEKVTRTGIRPVAGKSFAGGQSWRTRRSNRGRRQLSIPALVGMM